MTLSKMAFSTTLNVKIRSKTTFNMMTLGKMTFSVMTLIRTILSNVTISKLSFSTTTPSITILSNVTLSKGTFMLIVVVLFMLKDVCLAYLFLSFQRRTLAYLPERYLRCKKVFIKSFQFCPLLKGKPKFFIIQVLKDSFLYLLHFPSPRGQEQYS